MKKETLLERAMNRPPKERKQNKERNNEITDEQIELAISWLQNDITYTEVCYALGITNSGSLAYGKLAQYLREGYKRGIVMIEWVNL